MCQMSSSGRLCKLFSDDLCSPIETIFCLHATSGGTAMVNKVLDRMVLDRVVLDRQKAVLELNASELYKARVNKEARDLRRDNQEAYICAGACEHRGA